MELAEKEITINGMRFQAERLHPNYRGEYDCRCEECIFDFERAMDILTDVESV